MARFAARTTALATLLLGAAAGRAAHAANAAAAAAGTAPCPAEPPPFVETQLQPREAAANEALGVAAAISGDTAVFGAPLAGQGTAATGAAYVFVRSGPSAWAEQARLQASGGVPGELFGASVAISGDTLVIGALPDGRGDGSAGSAYVFVRSGTAWSQQARLTGAGARVGDDFGRSVAIAGGTVLVGAPGTGGRGAAYVFARTGTRWGQQARVTPGAAGAGALAGWSVAIAGGTAVLGAPGGGAAGGSSGAAFVVALGAGGEQQQLLPSDAAPAQLFGTAVAIGGGIVVVGAPGDGGQGPQAGAAYAFAGSGGAWQQQAKLTATDGAAGASLGTSVALSGAAALVGAPGAAGQAGAAYEFSRSGAEWAAGPIFTASNGAPGDLFGWSVGLGSVDSSTTVALAGAQGHAGAGSDSGLAYAYEKPTPCVPPQPHPRQPVVDLAVTISAPGMARVDAGSFAVVVKVVNQSTQHLATNVHLVVTLGGTAAGGLNLTGECTGQQVITCDLGAIPRLRSTLLTLVFATQSPGTLTVSAAASADQPDPMPGNNSAQGTTRVVQPAISLAVSPAQQTVGRDTVMPAFEVTVTNSGDTVLDRVEVSDPEVASCNAQLHTLQPGAVVTYRCGSDSPAGTFTNVLRATGIPPVGQPVAATASAAVIVQPPPPLSPRSFYTVTPCRLLDTRTGTPMAANVAGVFQVSGSCAIPVGAVAISANLTVVAPLCEGSITAFPGDAVEAPFLNVLSFSVGQTRANNMVLPLAGDGSGTIKIVVVALSEGTADALLDVSGYFQ